MRPMGPIRSGSRSEIPPLSAALLKTPISGYLSIALLFCYRIACGVRVYAEIIVPIRGGGDRDG